MLTDLSGLRRSAAEVSQETTPATAAGAEACSAAFSPASTLERSGSKGSKRLSLSLSRLRLKRGRVRKEQERSINDWIADDVMQWLTALDLDFYGPVFEASQVDGQKLRSITGESGFERLGVTNYRDALTLWHSLQSLREQHASASAESKGATPADGVSKASGASTAAAKKTTAATATAAPTGIAAWEWQDVRAWLATCGKSKWESAFAAANVTGAVLADISSNVAFEKLGVNNARDCMDLFRALSAARKEAAAAAETPPLASTTTSTPPSLESATESATSSAPVEQEAIDKASGSLSLAETAPSAAAAAPPAPALDVRARVAALVVPRMSDLGVSVARVHEPVALPVSVAYVPTDASEEASSASQAAGLVLDDTAQRAMLARCKKMLIDLLRQMPARATLHDVIFVAPQTEEERRHKAYTARVSMSDGLTARARSRAVSVVGASLAQLQSLVQQSIRKLCAAGAISEADDYQALKNALALDIRHHALLRRDRRKELGRLEATRSQLDGKTRLLRDRIAAYEEYTRSIASGGSSSGVSPGQQLTRKPSGTLAGGSGLGSGAIPGSTSTMKPEHKPSLRAAAAAATAGGRFGTHKWTGTKLKQRRALVSVAAVPGVLPLKDIVVEVASYSAGEYRMSAMVRRGEFERAVLHETELRSQAAAPGGATAELVPGLVFNLSALLLLLNKKF